MNGKERLICRNDMLVMLDRIENDLFCGSISADKLHHYINAGIVDNLA